MTKFCWFCWYFLLTLISLMKSDWFFLREISPGLNMLYSVAFWKTNSSVWTLGFHCTVARFFITILMEKTHLLWCEAAHLYLFPCSNCYLKVANVAEMIYSSFAKQGGTYLQVIRQGMHWNSASCVPKPFSIHREENPCFLTFGN